MTKRKPGTGPAGAATEPNGGSSVPPDGLPSDDRTAEHAELEAEKEALATERAGAELLNPATTAVGALDLKGADRDEASDPASPSPPPPPAAGDRGLVTPEPAPGNTCSLKKPCPGAAGHFFFFWRRVSVSRFGLKSLPTLLCRENT